MKKSQKVLQQTKPLNFEHFFKVLPYPLSKQTATQKTRSIDWLFVLLIIFTCLFFLYTAFVLDRYYFHFTEKTGYEKNIFPSEEKRTVKKTFGAVPLNLSNSEHLEWLVVNSAIINFKNEKKRYPSSLDELRGAYPDNWISYIPENVTYRVTSQGYKLYFKGMFLKAPKAVLELEAYPLAHKLSLSFNGVPLAIYPIAISKKGMPFASSYVTERVVDPNGENSPFGSRGLALQDQVAIHGTNTPSSIGKSVTEGCFRLFNQDIEELYPFIPKGTGLKVKDRLPSSAIFSNGLPSFAKNNASLHETNPSFVYQWRH